MSGKFYEELQVGDEFAHLPARTITETDNLLFTTLTTLFASLIGTFAPSHVETIFNSCFNHY